MNSIISCKNFVLTEEFLIENANTIIKEQKEPNFSLTADEIKQILMRNSDGFDNADSAIEFLVRSNDYFSDDASSSFFSSSKIPIDYLHQKLTKSNFLIENRNHYIDDQEESIFSIKKFSTNSDAIVFSYSILIMIIRSEFNKENSMYKDFDQLIQNFRLYSIQSNFSPINTNFIKKIDEKIETDLSLFAGIPSGSSEIFQNGIASNGHFIFVLHSDFYLSIFPISIENGGFLSPIMCKLNIDSNNENASLSFLSEKLIVTTTNLHFVFDITSLIQNEQKVPESQKKEKYSVVVTDGVVNVHLTKEKEFVFATVKSVDSDRIINKVQLHKNFDQKMYESHPLNDCINLLSCPSETNGIVLSFYMKIDTSHILIRHFSLIDGSHLKDDLIETNINICSITYDSISQMHYVVVDNGQLVIYALNGSNSCSVDPFLFGFSIADSDNKQKKFSLFSKNSLNDEFLKIKEFTFLFSSILLSSIFFKKDINTFIFEEKESIHVITFFILEIAESLINSDKEKDDEMNKIKLSSLNIFSILFVINVRHQFSLITKDKNSETFNSRFQSTVFDMLLQLSKIKEPFIMNVVSFIFLHLFDLINFTGNNYQSILEGLLLCSNSTLSKYIIHIMFHNSAQLSLLSFSKSAFSKYVVDNFILSKVHPNIVSFLLCYQRCIINQLHLSLKKEHYSIASLIIINNDCKTDNEALNIFGEYTNFLVNQLSSSIANSSSFGEIQSTTIYFLFKNFLDLILGLYNYHEVAQIVTPLLHIIQDSLKNFFDHKKIVVKVNDEAHKILTNIGLTFGAFTGTLIKGGNYSMFDEKYKWLIRPNMNLIEHPNLLHELDNPSSNVETYSDENVRLFLSINGDGKEIMQNIYKKWNFNMNKNLNEPLLGLDQLFLAVEIYHLKLFNELKGMEINKIRPALQQMMRVRNAARLILRSNNSNRNIEILPEEENEERKLKRKKSDSNELNSYYSPFDLIVIKCKMLLRLTSKFDNTNISMAPKLLADFVLSPDQPNTFINYISNQRNRLQLTNIGFSLIEASYSLKIDEFFIQIIDATLSITVDNFDGLSEIIRYDDLHKSEKYISNFLLKALKSIEYPYLSLIAYKLIKSEVLSKEAIGKAFESFVPYALNDSKLFGLFYKKFGYIKNILTNSDKFLFYDSKSDKKVPLSILSLDDFDKISTNHWYIISEAFSIQKVDFDLYQKVFQFFTKSDFNVHLNNTDILLFLSNCIFYFYQNCDESYTEQKITADFLILLKLLGKSLVLNDNLEKASSIVSIFRNILNQANKASSILIKLFNSYEISSFKSKNDEYNEIICAIFATLGGFVDLIQPNFPVSYRLDREIIHHGILINNNKILEIPINGETSHIEVNKYGLYPESMIPFNCSMFPNFQFIKSFLKYALTESTQKVELLYLNSLSFYLKEKDFVRLLSEKDVKFMIKNLSCLMNPFDTMKDTQIIISLLNSMKKIKGLSDCKFSVMSNDSIKCTTYLSPVLKPIKTHVFVESNSKFEGYFGLVADCPLENQFPYVIIHSKLGIIYPGSIGKDVKKAELNINYNVSFTVDSTNNLVILGKESSESQIKVHFPFLENKNIKFRIYICVFNQCEIKSIQVSSPESSFYLDYIPPPIPIYEPVKMGQLIKYPNNFKDEQLKDFAKKNKLIQFNPLTDFEINNNNLFEMVNIKNLLFNFKQADSISDDLKSSIISHVYSKLITQMSTIIVMQLVNNDFINLLIDFKPPYLIKLYSYLQIPLENYDSKKISKYEFPFEFSKPILQENILTAANQQFDNLEFEMKKCLRIISSYKKFNEFLEIYINEMFNNPFIHTLCNYSLNARFYDMVYLHYYLILSIPDDSESIIVSTPQLSSFQINQVTKYFGSENENIRFPFIQENGEIMIGISQIKEHSNRLGVLSINKFNNNWVYGTPFELLLLLKEYYFNTKEPVFFRKILIDLILINSPYVSMFVSKLLIRFGQDCFFSPSQFQKDYLRDLYCLSCLLNSFPLFVDKNLDSFISHENRALNFPILSKLAPFFPEFHQSSFLVDVDPNMKIQLKLRTINLIEATDDLLDEFNVCVSIVDENDSIKSHYYDILIIWLSISMFNLKNNPKMNIEQDGIFEVNKKGEFNCEFYPSKIHDAFINDIETIKNQWPKERISSFVSSFPSNILKSDDFTAVCNFSLSKEFEYSSVCSPRVILLLSYAICKINFLYENYRNEIPNDAITSISFLLPYSETSQAFLDSIISLEFPPMIFFVNRFEAHRISVEGIGSQSMSVIGQISPIMTRYSIVFRNSESVPWIVQFVNERAIDCGGPGRELFTEISMSIFEPTTGLFVISPNGRNKCGSTNREVYVPFHSIPANNKLIEMKNTHRNECYRSIGIFIGIVIRLGFYQDLPFAPIVWKAIAGEKINERDIFIIDQRFHDFIKTLRKARDDAKSFESIQQPILWCCENWDGSTVQLNNPTKSKFVLQEHIDTYINLCIRKRIDVLLESANFIREGFCENIGFYNHKFMSGNLLSFLAQGSSSISISELKKIFILISPFQKTYEFFWEAVEMMNDKQRSLLLKFITGLTKLPKNDHNFFIRVEIKTDRIDFLPMASTCFNILYLPIYSSKQVAFDMFKIAIESCQTMENA